jgi:hypothetical protein
MNQNLGRYCLIALLGLHFQLQFQCLAATPRQALRTIRAVGTEGQGNVDASAAWRDLAQGRAQLLPDILEAMDDASPLALNWLRAAVDAIAARELAANRPLPIGQLEKFLARKTHHPRARRLAYELIQQAEPDRAAKLIESMIDDPSTELRRDAIELVLADARRLTKAGRKDEGISRYSTALKSARDVDQVESIAKSMKELGQSVNLIDVFGWLCDWKVVGPFDNTGGAGFEKVFPPEEQIDWKAQYDGKTGKVRWQSHAVTNEAGLVDLNKPLGALKGVTGYACATITSSKDQTVELRLGSKNGWKVWLNGKFLFGRDEYHRGAEIDQYRLKARLKRGENRILVKLCQNEQTEDWTKEWEFQLRITDDVGTPIDLAQR